MATRWSVISFDQARFDKLFSNPDATLRERYLRELGKQLEVGLLRPPKDAVASPRPRLIPRDAWQPLIVGCAIFFGGLLVLTMPLWVTPTGPHENSPTFKVLVALVIGVLLMLGAGCGIFYAFAVIRLTKDGLIEDFDPLRRRAIVRELVDTSLVNGIDYTGLDATRINALDEIVIATFDPSSVGRLIDARWEREEVDLGVIESLRPNRASEHLLALERGCRFGQRSSVPRSHRNSFIVRYYEYFAGPIPRELGSFSVFKSDDVSQLIRAFESVVSAENANTAGDFESLAGIIREDFIEPLMAVRDCSRSVYIGQ